MTKSILKTVFVGIVIGALAFFMPRLLIGIFIFALIMRLFCRCGHRQCGGHLRGGKLHMLDKIRSMSDEEYIEFKSMHGRGCCHSKQMCDSESKCCSDSKSKQTTK